MSTEIMLESLVLDLTEDDLEELFFKVFKMRMGPPDEDGFYHLILLEPELVEED